MLSECCAPHLIGSPFHNATFLPAWPPIIRAQNYLNRSLPHRQTRWNTSGKSKSFSGLVGIYTLTEGAGQRAKGVLERMFPKARFEINGDAVATGRLNSLAKNADIFVFAWKSSKHQAYYCIKEARLGQDIVMPIGKGSASILTGVLDAISCRPMP